MGVPFFDRIAILYILYGVIIFFGIMAFDSN
jgi:hypothetical protein